MKTRELVSTMDRVCWATSVIAGMLCGIVAGAALASILFGGVR